MLAGKKLRRVRLPRQFRVSEEMAAEIERRADRNCRSKEDQIRFLILMGMMREDDLADKSPMLTFPHAPIPPWKGFERWTAQ